MNRKGMYVFAVLLLAASAWDADAQGADVIYRCRQKGGSTTIQNHPCDPGSRQKSVQVIQAQAWDPDAALRSRQIAVQMQNRGLNNQYQSSPYLMRSGNGVGRCASAKAQREAVLKTVGLRRTFDLLRRLDEMVFQACR